MGLNSLRYRKCCFATPIGDGSKVFWQDAIFEGVDEHSYYFRFNGKIVAVPRERVIKVEFDVAGVAE